LESANIKETPSKYTWVLWAAEFTPSAPQGSNRIVVRATDKTGQVQTSEVRPPFPDRNTLGCVMGFIVFHALSPLKTPFAYPSMNTRLLVASNGLTRIV
jgi:hypothetical protein